MSNLDGKVQELAIKQLISQIIKNQLSELEAQKQESNSKLVHFEKSTLNLIVNLDGKSEQDGKGEIQAEHLDTLAKVMDENKKDFEEILALLKNNLSS